MWRRPQATLCLGPFHLFFKFLILPGGDQTSPTPSVLLKDHRSLTIWLNLTDARLSFLVARDIPPIGVVLINL